MKAKNKLKHHSQLGHQEKGRLHFLLPKDTLMSAEEPPCLCVAVSLVGTVSPPANSDPRSARTSHRPNCVQHSHLIRQRNVARLALCDNFLLGKYSKRHAQCENVPLVFRTELTMCVRIALERGHFFSELVLERA